MSIDEEDLDDFVELLAPYCFGGLNELDVLRGQVQTNPVPPFVPWMIEMFEVLLDPNDVPPGTVVSVVERVTGDPAAGLPIARAWLERTSEFLLS